MTDPGDNEATVRVDRWLWAARFFKTRALAQQAVAGGKVHVNGQRAKPSRGVRPGDALEIRKGSQRLQVTVRAVSDRRGPASEASTLYEEWPESRTRREQLATHRRLAPAPGYDNKGRPTKKDRRALERWRRGR